MTKHRRHRAALALLAGMLAAPAWGATATELADRARALARQGWTSSALELYREALAAEPERLDIRRDYAVVLGWAEDYTESRRQFRMVLERQPDQPVWALQEMTRSELFGGNAAGALALLERLVAAGDRSFATLNRRALALRWLNRSREAETAYRQALAADPESAEARAGLAYALADQDQMERALATADQALAAAPCQWELLKVKARILNWMGLHRKAVEVLDSIPPEHTGDPEVRELRISAQRWGGDPASAARQSAHLRRELPERAAGAQLSEELKLEYGDALTTSVRFIGDSDGLQDRTYGEEVSMHAGPAHQFRLGYQYRGFSQNEEAAAFNRYEAGWSGVLGRRVAAWASVSSLDYLDRARGQRLVGDVSLSVWLSDRFVLSAGGGSIAMDAFRSVQNRVTGRFSFATLNWRPRSKVSVEVQYAQYFFSDGVRRDRVNVSAYRRLYHRPAFRLELGERSNLMWHDRATPDFYSPSAFQTHLAMTRLSGRLGRRWEYAVEAGAGVQREPHVALESPVVGSATLAARLTRNLSLDLEAGGGSSSLERVSPGRSSYSRHFFAANLRFRFD